MTKKIELTKGYFAIVDDEDYTSLSKWKWYYNDRYASRSRHENGKATRVFMHRFIMNAAQGTQVDHINGDKLDNRRSNLRLATNQENAFNRRKKDGCTSKYKGVSWDKHKKKWKAEVTFNRKTIHIGYYDSEIEAAMAYDLAAKTYFGVFANLNFKVTEL